MSNRSARCAHATRHFITSLCGLITLMAFAVTTHAAANLSANPSLLTFPDTVQTVTATGIDLQIINGGFDDAVDITFAVTGANANDFSVTTSTLTVAGASSEIWTSTSWSVRSPSQ
jgi:hypothetical protein